MRGMNLQRLEIVSGKAPFHSRFYLWMAKTRDVLRGLRLPQPEILLDLVAFARR